jgi:hypothetical protein
MSEEQERIFEKEAVNNAIYQARNAAQMAREFAPLFDEYADLLSAGGGDERADEKRCHALDRLRLLKESFEQSDEWMAQARALKACVKEGV